MKHTIICSDNVAYLNTLAENSLDACITDPPYGMSIIGIGWDKNVPPKETWEAVYRVLKPGAFVLSFCNTQYYHRMATKIEEAGFIPKDMVMWLQSHKMFKTNRLKDSHEPIMVAQKPLDGTIKGNAEKWGPGKINIENARIPYQDKDKTGGGINGHSRRKFAQEEKKDIDWLGNRNFGQVKKEDKQNVYRGFGKNKEQKDADKSFATTNAGLRSVNQSVPYNKWVGHPNGRYPGNVIGEVEQEYQKYFYAPVVSPKERGEYNNHPCPKPISLMRYLCRIFAPKGGTVIDPFMGSGSTLIGALQEDMACIGIDMDQHYCDIAERRIQDHCCNTTFDKLFAYEKVEKE